MNACASQEIERFEYDVSSDRVVRFVQTTNGTSCASSVPSWCSPLLSRSTPAERYDASWLRAPALPEPTDPRDTVRVADLFSGCGGMLLGVAEACRALGMAMDPVLAVDVDPVALSVLSRNFPRANCREDDLERLMASSPNGAPTDEQQRLQDQVGAVNLLLGGPPCQGHSNLNNNSRRRDPKNSLFFTMARAAELLRPDHIIVENVRFKPKQQFSKT